ncbi:hypothetical protein R5W24_003885 [Gemmata sp. JC717]|uniref:hypothetical protein n=1 Tax=Gemmata algarum TaxID=2975278 RepID=UPI0021BACC2C|nr:hypothetical protein [Gemmata algarum]MDY3554756.1 hypothetical protein [Gemmata algarum]
MRASLALALAVTLGALTMTDSTHVTAQEPKKDEKKPRLEPGNPNTYTQLVSIRVMTSNKKLINPVKNVRAEWAILPSGKQVIYTESVLTDTTVGSEITDKDGVVWVVEKAVKGTSHYLNYARKKDEPKKEEPKKDSPKKPS